MVSEKFTGGKVDLKLTEIVYDQGKSIYSEYHNGYWEKFNYDKEGELSYVETSSGDKIYPQN